MMRWLLALAFLALSGLAAQAQTGPLEISADRFTVDEKARQSEFSGNVVASQRGLTLSAQSVVVRFGTGGPSDIESFEASGGVKVTTADQTATGERASYDPSRRIIRLRGNVRVSSASGSLSGPELIVNLDDNTTTFSGGGGGGRVTGVFTPQ